MVYSSRFGQTIELGFIYQRKDWQVGVFVWRP